MRCGQSCNPVMLVFACTLWGAAISVPAMAADFCTDLKSMMHGTTSTIAPPAPFIEPGTCAAALAPSGARSMHCNWPFAYRAARATQLFETLMARVPDCLAADAKPHDQGVNHPDTYDLRLFSFEGGEAAVSLKDKAGLQKTYVFLRIAARP